MKETRRTVNRIAQPVKTLAQRFAFMALVLAAVALIVLGRVDVGSVERARTQILDAAAPILIDALQLAMGGRGDARAVREGAARAEVVARLEALRDAPRTSRWMWEPYLVR